MERDELHLNIGEWLAAGFTDEQIILELQDTDVGLSKEEAESALKEVYQNWQNTKDALSLNETDLLAWHIFMRKRLLQLVLQESTIPSQRLALSILDSLAQIEKITGVVGAAPVPLPLVPVQEKEEGKEDG